jgi:hypothetical protein
VEYVAGGIAFIWLSYQLAFLAYLNGKGFKSIKSAIAKHVEDCNTLNQHIEELKLTYSESRAVDYGHSTLHDTSHFNMRRRKWTEEQRNGFTYNCSASVLKNAHDQPFKYLCKYFGIKADEQSLSRMETVLNNFSAAEQGKALLHKEREAILRSVKKDIPFLFDAFSRKRLTKALGFNSIDLSTVYFPVYVFRYVSAGGNSSARTVIRLDLENIEKFILYLSGIVKFKKSIAGQRALMTAALREKIKKRDNYACRICRNSVRVEPNLLLEIDHIVALARGGQTVEENLQCLCWRCNRSKGAKILPQEVLQTAEVVY